MGKKKIKTHQATSKRFRKTGSGKIMRTKGFGQVKFRSHHTMYYQSGISIVDVFHNYQL